MVYRATVGTRFTGYARIIVAPGRGLGGEVLATGRPVRTANAATDPRVLPEHGSLVREEGSVAVMVAPIRAGARIEGLIYVDRRTPRPFGERDETVLLRLADHAAIALRNAQAFAGEQVARSGAEAQAGRARLVADASRVLAASHDYEATLARVARLVVPALADWSMVYLARRDGGVRRLAVAHADPDQAALAAEIAAMPATVNWQRDTSGTVRALREGEPILVVHVSAEVAGWDQVIADPDDRRIMRAIRPASLLLVPLVARGRTLGAMTWMRGGGRPAFTREDLALAGDVAARAALAVDNARLYRQAERARVDAERANRAKDEFLAVLSHELRTPLTSMLGWLRLLRTGQLAPEKTAQALEVVERNTRSQAQLINDLLDVSRIVAGKLQLDRYPVDLVPIVELAVESSRREAETREIALGLFADPGAGPVLGDPLRISQIVVNLLTNAVKFTPPGGRVEVRLARDGDHAVITVADTGIGIEPDVLPTVFDRFRQADSTITRRHGGLGLGLAIVRHLTELHGGRVKAESAGAGQGSTFTVRLPLTAARREGPAERPAAPGAATALAGLRVLLVEDHADTADLIRAILEGQGAAVRIATSLAGALDALADAPADMLISDIAMPDGTGFDLVRQLRAAERADNRPPLAAIALTAFAGADDRERGLAAGFQDYAAKPVEPTALVEIVARAAGRLVPKY
jgi:signal transduction histidine kinase/ActR/RegA family two-component response regulator